MKLAIVGLGYVGLPLARAACDVGIEVCGIDVSASVVESLQNRCSCVDDVSNSDIERMFDAGFSTSTTYEEISEADVIVICVPTPLGHDGTPDLTAVRSAGSEISKRLVFGQLIILESTTFPGTTEGVLIPILESTGLVAGRDFNVAFSPERIDPGNPRFRLENTPKVVGGHTRECTDRTTNFYRLFVDEVVPTVGTREAELSKLLENTYRHVNIALMNELVKYCHKLGIDLWESIRCASSKPFGFEAFYPGPGVGGHCIPIDPNYLAHAVKTNLGQSFRLVELAEEVNASMPDYVIRRLQDLLNDNGLPVRNSRILVLGVTYKENISDTRESPSFKVLSGLGRLGAQLTFHDPHLGSTPPSLSAYERVDNLESALADCDACVLLQAHSIYLEIPIDLYPRITLDTRGIMDPRLSERL